MSFLNLQVLLVICIFTIHSTIQGDSTRTSSRPDYDGYSEEEDEYEDDSSKLLDQSGQKSATFNHSSINLFSRVNLQFNPKILRDSIIPLDPNANGNMNFIGAYGPRSNRTSSTPNVTSEVAGINSSVNAWPSFLLRYWEREVQFRSITPGGTVQSFESFNHFRREITVDVKSKINKETLLHAYTIATLRLTSAKKTDTVCYEIDRAPFYDCIQSAKSGGKFESFPYFKRDYTSFATTMKLELCPTGKRLLYLDQMDGGLKMSFLHQLHTDHMRLLPGFQFIDVSFDWIHGVLFTLDAQGKLQVWAMPAQKEPEMQAQFQVAVDTKMKPALTCNQKMEKFYIHQLDGSIAQIDYSASRRQKNLVLETVFPAGICRGPDQWPRTSTFRPSLVSHKNYIYCISWVPGTSRQKLVRLDVITNTSSNVFLPEKKGQYGFYTQLALDQVDEEDVSEIEKSCSGCHHRCIPVYNQSPKCECPFGQLGFHINTQDWNNRSKLTSFCVSNDVEMVQLINTPGLGDRLQHMEWNPNESPMGVSKASSDTSYHLVPADTFLPVWNFGSRPFFCVRSSQTYSCHSYRGRKKPLFEFRIPDFKGSMQAKTLSQTSTDEWIVSWKSDRCVYFQMFNSSTLKLDEETYYTLYCHYELVDSIGYQARQIPDDVAIDGQSYTIVFSDKEKLCVVKPGGGRGIETTLIGKLEKQKDLAIRNDIVLHMSADNKHLITTFVEGPPQSFQFSMENSKIMPSEFQATWMSPTSNCWIEKDQLVGRYIKCIKWDTQDVKVFMPPSGASLASFAVSYSHLDSTSAHPCYNGNNTCSHLCVPKGDVSVKQYTCLCPDELPVNLDGLCTIRLRMNAIMTMNSENSSGITQRIIFNDADVPDTINTGSTNISLMEHFNLEIYDAGTKRICYVIASDKNIRCASPTNEHLGPVIAGSNGTRFFVGGFTQVFGGEMYWSSVDEAESANYRQCFHLGSMSSEKPSMQLSCVYVNKVISDQHVTLDPQRKTLFYFETVKGDVSVRALPLVASEKSEGASVPISAHSSFRKLNSFSMEFLRPKIIACDDTVKKVYTVTVDEIESEYNIHSIGYNTHPSISLDVPRQNLKFGDKQHIATLVPFRGYLFWYNSSDELWGRRPTSERPFKVVPYSANMTLTPLSMIATYTPEELKLQSPCFGTRCEFYCHVVETGIKPVAQCLCNKADGGYRFCDPLRDPVSVEQQQQQIQQEQDSDWALPTGISIGVFLLLAVCANIGGCIYLRKRNKAEMDRIIEGFMEGDTDRASAARNEAEEAEFLPFTAIIKPEDLALNQTKILGEGNFGTVYEGLFDRKVVAVKTVKSNLDPQVIEDFLRELKITAYVGDHEQIVRFYGAEISRIHDGRVLVVLELCPNGDLLSYIRKYTEWDWCDFEESVDISEPNVTYVPVEAQTTGEVQGHSETTMDEVHADAETARYVCCPLTSTTIPNPGYEVLIASPDQTENLDSASMSVEHDFVIDLSKLFEEIESAADVLPVPTPAARRASKGQESNTNIEPLTKGSTPAQVTKETTTLKLPKECVVWAHQIAIGMEYLERKKVIHGDLAARNILVFDNNTVKISDFGFSRNVYQYQTYQKKTACPLPYRWCSPETLSRLEFSSKADVWSYAVTVWEMFAFGNVPFANLVWDVAFVDRIVEQGMRLEKPHSMPQKLYDEIMALCWQVDPAQRPNFTQLRDMFKSVLNSM